MIERSGPWQIRVGSTWFVCRSRNFVIEYASNDHPIQSAVVILIISGCVRRSKSICTFCVVEIVIDPVRTSLGRCVTSSNHFGSLLREREGRSHHQLGCTDPIAIACSVPAVATLVVSGPSVASDPTPVPAKGGRPDFLCALACRLPRPCALVGNPSSAAKLVPRPRLFSHPHPEMCRALPLLYLCRSCWARPSVRPSVAF